ncbi:MULTISPECIES: IS3 family transposase [unclassified Gordonia (in: high G+C Gram-positive bacteria)]
MEVIKTVHTANFGVCGVLKMHHALRRDGHDVGREQTRWLMWLAGVRGGHRGRTVFTTRPDPSAEKPADLVKRKFVAEQQKIRCGWWTSRTCVRGRDWACQMVCVSPVLISKRKIYEHVVRRQAAGNDDDHRPSELVEPRSTAR